MTNETAPVRISVTLDIDGDIESDPLKVVGGIGKGMKALDVHLSSAVSEARRQDITWQQIGDALGISRQAAWERFAAN